MATVVGTIAARVGITRSTLLDLQLIPLRATLAEDEDVKRPAAIT
jgi:hypothetical protein